MATATATVTDLRVPVRPRTDHRCGACTRADTPSLASHVTKLQSNRVRNSNFVTCGESTGDPTFPMP
jgi:hypothetical protein